MKYVRQRLDLIEAGTKIECLTRTGSRIIYDVFDFPIPLLAEQPHSEESYATPLGLFAQENMEVIEVKDEWYARSKKV